MPELPEVETIVSSLHPLLKGKEFSAINILNKNTVKASKKVFANFLIAKKIQKVTRYGKYILFVLDNGCQLVTHLRMSGKFIYPSEEQKAKHDRVNFVFTDKSKLVYSDVRCFGTMELLKKDESIKEIKKLGLDALDKKFNLEYLSKKLQNKNLSIKDFLLEQNQLAGIGNIYASEILFASGISPFKICNTISKKNTQKILENTQKILSLAVKHNGTSISDYRRVDDKKGEFQNFLKVYGRKDEVCSNCNSPIQKAKQRQRSTFYCAKCQK